MASSDMPQEKMADNDSALSDVLNSSNDGDAGEAGGFGATQTLALPLPVAEDTVSEEIAQEEPRSDAEIAAEMEGYAAQLETALAGAGETLEAKAASVRNAVRQSAASARAGIRATVERTVTSIQAGGNSLLSELARGVSAAHGVVKGCLSARSTEANGKGTTSQKTITGIFSGHRKTVDGTVKTAVEDAEKLRTKKVESAKKRNQADIKTAYARGGAKMRSFPATNRGAFVGGAAFDVAEGTAKEMAGQEPDIVAAINEVTAPLPQHFRDQGVEALNGFDQNLPDIIASVVTGTEQTDGELTKSAADAHKQLDQFAVDTEGEITGLMEDATSQAQAILPPAEQQLDQALGTILRSIAAAPKEVTTRVTPPIEEAITLFRGGEDADVESAPQLTETLLGFLNESVASTSAKLEQAGTAGKARFQAMSGSSRQAMRALQSRTEATWKVSRSGISTTLTRAIAGADAGLGAIVKTFGDALGETEQSIRDQLSPVVTDLKGSFDQSLKDAEVDIDSRISDGMAKNTEALGGLDAKMQEAVDEAAWEWDHPVLSALSFIAGILVGIIKVLALVLLLIVVVIVLAKVLAVSALVAGIILLVGMAAFSIGYAFGARLAAGQGVGEAFGGAVMDFGRAAPGMLYDMTGIPKLKRAFSDERMTPYERGKLVGEGGTELVLAIFMVRGAAKGIAKGFRKLPRIPWPRRPVRVPTGKIAPIKAPPPAQSGGLGKIPGGGKPSGTPGATPELRVIKGGGGEPTTTIAPEPAPKVSRPDLRVIEGGGQQSVTPPRSPNLRVIKGGGGGGKGPITPEAQPQVAAKAAGAEGYEPMLGEQIQPPAGEVGLRPGGRSPLDVRASGQSSGGGGRGGRGPGPRQPASETPASTGGRGDAGPRPGRARPRPAERPPAEAEPAASQPPAETAAPAGGRGGGSGGASRPRRGGRQQGTAEGTPAEGGTTPGTPRPRRSRGPRSEQPRPGTRRGRGRGGRRAPRDGERPPTRAERRAQARRDAESGAAQREFQGTEPSPAREPTPDELLAGEGGPQGTRGTAEPGEFGGTQVRRGPGGRQTVSEDRAIAEAAGNALERPMVQEFAGAQPATAQNFASRLGNWRLLRERFPRIAEIFSAGERPDLVSVDRANRRIDLFDATSRPNAEHLAKSQRYMDRLMQDPVMQREFGGWEIRARERYWEHGFGRVRPVRRGRIPGGSSSGGSTGGGSTSGGTAPP